MSEGKKIEVSSEADVSIGLDKETGRAEVSFQYEGKLGGASVTVFTDAAKLVDAVTDIIPGEWDDALLDDLAKKILSKKSE